MRGRALVTLFVATGVAASAGTVVIVRLSPPPQVIAVPGPAGADGVDGMSGTVGPRGPVGPAGEQGPRGEQGEKGEPGSPGDPGKEGATGTQGSPGKTGERGPRGLRGLRGPAGPQGEPGKQGEAGLRGETGKQGEAGAKGDTGAAGPAGVQGEQGATGATGATGNTGPTGPRGERGDPGGFGAYGSFYDTTDVPLTLDEATPVPLGQTDFASGVSIVGGSQITMAVTGKFNIAFSIQLEKTDTGTDWVSIWLRKNGDDVAWTNTDVAVVGQDANSRTVVAWNFFVEATAVGDRWQLMIASTTSATGRMLIQSVDPQTSPARPAIPGVIVTVNQVG